MIHIDQDQTISENDNLRVVTSTGDYEDTALIEFYDITEPTLVTGAFQAQYVKYGSMMYRFNDPVELGRELLKIDPLSTHTAASYVRMTDELLSKMHDGTLESTSLDQVVSVEQDAMKEQISDYASEEQFERPPEAGQFVGQEGPLTDDTVSPSVGTEEIVPVVDQPVDVIPTLHKTPLSEEIVTAINTKGRRKII
jgi:hypothetical protein